MVLPEVKVVEELVNPVVSLLSVSFAFACFVVEVVVENDEVDDEDDDNGDKDKLLLLFNAMFVCRANISVRRMAALVIFDVSLLILRPVEGENVDDVDVAIREISRRIRVINYKFIKNKNGVRVINTLIIEQSKNKNIYSKMPTQILIFLLLIFIFVSTSTSSLTVGTSDTSVSATGPSTSSSLSDNPLLMIIQQQEQLIKELQIENYNLKQQNNNYYQQNQKFHTFYSTLSNDNNSTNNHPLNSLRKEILRLMYKDLQEMPNISGYATSEIPNIDISTSNNTNNTLYPYTTIYNERYQQLQEQWQEPQYIKLTCKDNIDVSMRPINEEEKLEGIPNIHINIPSNHPHEKDCLVFDIIANPEFAARFVIACEENTDNHHYNSDT